VINKSRLKELRREVKKEFSRLDSEGILGGCAARAALQFLKIVKLKLFKFDREEYLVKIDAGWSILMPVVIGPDDQISHLTSGQLTQRMTEFSQVSEIVLAYEPECRLTLKIDGQPPLVLTTETTTELNNLADLIDGHCRGTRIPRQGTIITTYRELPTLPLPDLVARFPSATEAYNSSNGSSINLQPPISSKRTGNHNFRPEIPVDDDYAEIGEQLENVVKFDSEWEIDRNLLVRNCPKLRADLFPRMPSFGPVRNCPEFAWW